MRVTTFLMFTGDARAWIDMAVSVVPESEVVFVQEYGPEGPGPEGTVAASEVLVGGLLVRCYDSFVEHEFGFTPAMSLFADLDSVADHDRVHAALAEGGEILMPPDDYGFSERFSWVQDRFGVSWQLNVP